MLGIRGLVAATLTPFDVDGTLALEQVGPMVDDLIRRGIAGLYVVGSTGEGVSLTTAERQQAAAEFVTAAGGRVPVIVQVGHNSVAEAAGLARHAARIGATAISAAPPSYFPIASVDQLVDCIEPIAAAAPELPFYYYHIPSRTDVHVDLIELFEKAGHIPSFKGVKFTSPEIASFQAAQSAAGDRFELFYGCDEMLLSALAVGARAAVGSTYNIASGLNHRIIAAFERGDLEEAARYQAQSVELVRVILRWGVLGSQKALMAHLGFDCGPTRPPLRTLSSDDTRNLLAELEEKDLMAVLDGPA